MDVSDPYPKFIAIMTQSILELFSLHGVVLSPSATRGLPPKGLRTRDIYIPDLHIDSLPLKPRNFR